MDFVKETPAQIAEREEVEGLRLPALPFAAQLITAAVLDENGKVTGILIDARADIEGVVQVDMADGPTVGAVLPWPRTKRDALLVASDWTEFRTDMPLAWRDAWTAYRQALRNLPEAQPDPTAIVWPTEPGA